ncbi:MAG TPA: hypothetical protein VKH81_21975 [Candidatus Angelobacter sp.]|nr:hypothetical protein [Candidatus Angelobacter sp.]
MGSIVIDLVIPTAVERARVVGFPFAPGFGVNGQISTRAGVPSTRVFRVMGWE